MSMVLAHTARMKMETTLDHRAILQNQRSTSLFTIRILADGDPQRSAEPAAYCLAIDTSASSSEAFDARRKLAKLFIRHLPANAELAIVAFNEEASTLHELAPIEDPAAISAMLDELSPMSCGSNLSAGWLLGRRELSKTVISKRELLLLTDGEHTLGIRDELALANLAEQCAREGIHVSTFANARANLPLLGNIARAGAGSFHRSISPGNLPKIVAAELGALRPVAAQNIRLRVHQLDLCEGIAILGPNLGVETQKAQIEYALGDLLTGEERTLCFNLQTPIFPAIDGEACASLAGEELVEIELIYDEICHNGVKSHAIRQRVAVEATDFERLGRVSP